MASALHLQLHYLCQFGHRTFMHFYAMNTYVKTAPQKNCAIIAPLYLVYTFEFLFLPNGATVGICSMYSSTSDL